MTTSKRVLAFTAILAFVLGLFHPAPGIAGFNLANLLGGGPGGDSRSELHSEVQYATTPDDWKIALEHVPSAYGNTGKIPVILCHGLGYNGDFWMLGRDVNLAQFLADQGYDVWVLSLRGAGKSTKWVYKLAEVGMEAPGMVEGINNKNYAQAAVTGIGMLFKLSQAKLVNASANPKYMNWSFDDYVNHDVPTAIEYVKKATGSPEVFWVGHSMGGNVMLAHLATNQRTDIRGVVTVGSQLTMSNGHVVAKYINTLQWLRLIELKNGADKERAREEAKAQARALLFNQDNMEGDVLSRLETAGTDTPAVGVMGQYLELLGSGKFKTSDNQFVYADNAHNITVPILMTAGAQDAFVNPVDLAFLRDNVSSQDREMLIWGPQIGMFPYGHNDALISRRASAEVYPVIAQWLDQHMYVQGTTPAGLPQGRPTNVTNYVPNAPYPQQPAYQPPPGYQQQQQPVYQQPVQTPYHPPVSGEDDQNHRRPMKALPVLDY